MAKPNHRDRPPDGPFGVLRNRQIFDTISVKKEMVQK